MSPSVVVAVRCKFVMNAIGCPKFIMAAESSFVFALISPLDPSGIRRMVRHVRSEGKRKKIVVL